MKNIISAAIIFCLFLLFWIFLLNGIVENQEYKEGIKSDRAWLIERSINNYNLTNK
ncbi:MAG TPA: hypothetical protein PLT06_11140 [Syntrophorhabdaceae bacterium]|nr:hypothetical protein [Syntrophorhabdaceae bacterium]